MGVIDDADDAEKAVKDLTQAGFHAEDIKAMHGEEAADQLDIKCEHCNLVKVKSTCPLFPLKRG